MTTVAPDLVLGPRVISFCRVPKADAAAANDNDDEEGAVLMTLRTTGKGEVLGWADIDSTARPPASRRAVPTSSRSPMS